MLDLTSEIDTPMSGSTTHWLFQLRGGNRDAAQPIWEKYFRKLVQLARQHLNGSPRRMADEEDVAICAFDSFCRGAEQGRFPKLDDSTDLWRILVTITERKAINQFTYDTRKKRSTGQKRSQIAETDLEANPAPWFCAQVAEMYVELLIGLRDDTLRSIALWKLEGYSNDEIASKLDSSRRSVERKLALIRQQWIDSDED